MRKKGKRNENSNRILFAASWEHEEASGCDLIEEGEQFVRLPNQYEINEYRIMEEFADFAGGGLKYASKEQASEIGHKLYEALQGRGAFRRFKNTLNHYGIADEYYAYRHSYYVELAKEWCQDHEIGFVRG